MKTIEQVAKLNCPDFFDKYPRSGAALAEFQSNKIYLNAGSEELALFNKKEDDCRKKRAATAASTIRAPLRKTVARVPVIKRSPSPVKEEVPVIKRTTSLIKEEIPVQLDLPVKRQSQEVKEILALDNSLGSFLTRLDDTSSLVFNKILDGLSAQKLLNLINEDKLKNTKEDKIIRKRFNILRNRIIDDYLGNHYKIKLQKRPPAHAREEGAMHPAPYYDYECIIDGIKFKAVLGPNWPKTEGQSSHKEDFTFKFVLEPIRINEPVFKITLLINLQKGNWPPSIKIDTTYEGSWNGPYTVPVPTFQSLLRITYITFMLYWKKTIKAEGYYKRVSSHMITDQIYNTGILRFFPIFRRHYSLRLEDTPFPQTNEALSTFGIDVDSLYANKQNPLGIEIDRHYHIYPYSSHVNSEGSFIVNCMIRFGEGLGDRVAGIDVIYNGTNILIQYKVVRSFRELFHMMKLINIDADFINNIIYVAVEAINRNIPFLLNDMEVQTTIETLRELLSNIIVEFIVVPSANPETRMGLIAA